MLILDTNDRATMPRRLARWRLECSTKKETSPGPREAVCLKPANTTAAMDVVEKRRLCASQFENTVSPRPLSKATHEGHRC